MLVEFGEASLADLAIALAADVGNVRGAFEGDGEAYRYEDALARLGLVEWRVVSGIVLYRPSAAGRRVAAMLRRERRRGARARGVGAL